MNSTPRRTTRLRPIHFVLSLLLAFAGVFAIGGPAYASGDFKGTLVDQLGQPVLGLEFDVWDSGTGTLVTTVTSDGTTGDFLLNLPDGSYYYWVHDGALDDSGDAYGLRSETFFITGADADLGNLEIRKYVDVTGTITNWIAAMGNIDVQLKAESGGSWFQLATTTSTGATFTISTPLNTDDYTLYFQLDSGSTAPYLPAYLGGEFLDPNAADMVSATAGTPVSGITMAMPAAALISGRVTDAVTHAGIPNIWVSTEDRPDYYYYDEIQTDANGYYTLRAIPGLTYAVYAYDPGSVYRSMTYQNFDGCGCAFTPVHTTYVTPATGIDFALIEEADAVFIEGFVLDDELAFGNPYDYVLIHLYKPVSGGWREIDVTYSDYGDFELLLPAFGSYRLRFEYGGVWLPLIDGLVAEGSAFPSFDPATAGCYVDTGVLDASSVNSDLAFFLVAGLNQAGGCGPEPTPSGSSGGGGHSTSGHGRSSTGVGGSLVAPSATPTPTPTPTSSPTPSSSPSGSPSPSETPRPIDAQPLDFTWVWWLIVLLILGIIITIIVIVRRR